MTLLIIACIVALLGLVAAALRYDVLALSCGVLVFWLAVAAAVLR